MTQNISIAELMTQSGVAFGTSGARGLVSAMTDRVCFAYTAAFLQHMADIGQFAPGTHVAIAGDLRPSSPRIMAACATAVRHRGGVVDHCGFVPSPAVAAHGFAQGIPSLMVTGSHIPDDRNGIKLNRTDGEVLKPDEMAIRAQHVALPDLFDDEGMLRDTALAQPVVDVATPYIARYVDAFGADALRGMKLGVYEHSAVGRDILVARALNIAAIATPVSCNSAVELSDLFSAVERTRIGSPFVIEAMNALVGAGQGSVCGYEANGGFLLATPVVLDGQTLGALPTRDAVLPILSVLVDAKRRGFTLSAL